MATDFTKKPLEILVDLIDLTNGISLTTTDITFGPVSALPPGGNRDTAVTIYAAPGSRYTGLRDLTYNRVDLSRIPRGRTTKFEDTTSVFVSQLIPQINQTYLINLQPEDYLNEPLPTLGNSQFYGDRVFYLKAAPESYVWQGSLQLTLPGNMIDLDSYLGTPLLSGFVLPPVDQIDLDTEISNYVLDGFIMPINLTVTLLDGFTFNS